MREISYIVVHCTATQPDAKVESIKRFWKENLGWKSPGYHHIIEANGTIVDLLPHEKISNGVAGWNPKIINIAYIGGVDPDGKPKDTRTYEQRESINSLLIKCKIMYPRATVCGHRDFKGVKKECPSFDALLEYKSL